MSRSTFLKPLGESFKIKGNDILPENILPTDEKENKNVPTDQEEEPAKASKSRANHKKNKNKKKGANYVNNSYFLVTKFR